MIMNYAVQDRVVVVGVVVLLLLFNKWKPSLDRNQMHHRLYRRHPHRLPSLLLAVLPHRL